MRPRSALRYSPLLLASPPAPSRPSRSPWRAPKRAPEGSDPPAIPATLFTPQPIRCTTRWPRPLRAAPR
ncbi:hypothetical protein ACPA9J_29640 [Pseudomonas aeruginosa]